MADLPVQTITLDTELLSNQSDWIQARDELVLKCEQVQSIDSDEELNVAGKLQAGMTKIVKQLGKTRLGFTSPANDWVKALIAKEKELCKPLSDAIARLKRLNSDYATKKHKEAEEERRRLEAEEAERAMEQISEAEESGKSFDPDSVEIAQKPTGRIRTDANRTVKRWKFVVVDSNAVPREFCSPDEKKIRAYIQANKDKEQLFIPGVVASYEMSVESRG